MCIADHANDLGQHCVRCRFRCQYGQRALTIYGARVDIVARLFWHQSAFTRNGRLIDSSRPVDNFTVQGNAVPSAHNELGSDSDGRGGNIRLRPILVYHPRGRRREVEKRRDGIACAPDAPAFKIQ